MSEPAVPLDPAAERNLRRLKAVVIILGVFLVLGLLALVAGIIWKASKPKGVSAAEPAALASGAPGLSLPINGTVTDMDLDGNRILLRVRSADGEELIVYDVAKGQIVTRVRLERAP